MNKTNDSRVAAVLWAVLAVLWSCAQVTRADYIYGEPTNIPNVSKVGAGSPQVSRDGLELYFAYNDPGECRDLWVARRSTTQEPWGTPVPLDPPVNSTGPAGGVCISADGLELYFADGYWLHWTGGCSAAPGGYGSGDLWVSKRAMKTDPWGEPQNLGPTVNTARWEDHPSLSMDGLSLYFASDRAKPPYSALWVTTRPNKNAPWGPPVMLGAPIAMESEGAPFISPDGLSLYFSEGTSPPDIYVSRRVTTASPWGKPVPFAPVNSPRGEWHLSFSTEDSALYFTRANTLTAIYELWQVTMLPIVDFNGDGKVDGKEVLAMADHWGQSNSLYDIGPSPWGDGIVDIADFKVLASYIGQEVNDPTLVAHWTFDETEGDVISDSAGMNDAFLMGSPLWEPTGGKVGGALQFDGTTFAATGSVLDPTAESFSVFAWVKGGAPRQGILSQDGVTWLMASAVDGKLATELSSNTGKWLCSPAVITDGNWHRVGVVCRDTSCTLYLDDKEAATGTRVKPTSTSSGLYIGAAAQITPDTFWNGLIDDVRVFNRVVEP
ncbi:MAG: PD40 domain-containing protein [Sedimentisphaerales bacterium]|nr:PD40 domain-containing protein [Sedimentisphaerales bacterium]